MKVIPELRRVVAALLVAAATLVVAGVLADMIWLIGCGAWALIAAGLIEVTYRP
ncbi:hypothetical protein [Streptomyces candidus]|uniref:Uncharacterized protein n=1 Tax=Streptomyces candidus TaxID=67283 RepID=A0A7X0LRV8_9ACTN|nr:hypothetical protein [Streptomyces candidus]MBB6438555.1 hypothetical protein [Streptomyces candidus]GHH45482.1 hypothetical protein GCM10018773_34970 [Streptomyces candidus]